MLVVIAESPLEAKYNAQPVIRTPLGYALALVITQGETISINAYRFSFNNDVTDNALTWVSHQYLESHAWQTPSSSNGTWLWQKKLDFLKRWLATAIAFYFGLWRVH